MNPEALAALAGSKGKTRDLPGLRRGRAIDAATAVPVWPVVFVPPQFFSLAQSAYCRLNMCTSKSVCTQYDQITELRGAPLASGTYDVPEMSPYAAHFANAARVDVLEYIDISKIRPLYSISIVGLEDCSRLCGRLDRRLHRLLDGAVITACSQFVVTVAGHTYTISFRIPNENSGGDGVYSITQLTMIDTGDINVAAAVSASNNSIYSTASITSYFQTVSPMAQRLFALIQTRLTSPAKSGIVSALLYGLPGNGKSMFASVAVARLREAGVPAHLMTLDLVSAVEYLSSLLSDTSSGRTWGEPTVLFIDEIDSEQTEQTFVAFHSRVKSLRDSLKPVYILAATNRLSSLPLNVVAFSFPICVEFKGPEYTQRIELIQSKYAAIHAVLEELTLVKAGSSDWQLDSGITAVERVAEQIEGLSYADIASIFVQLQHFVQTIDSETLTVQMLQDALTQLVVSARPSSLMLFDIIHAHGAQVGGLDQELETIKRMLSSAAANSLLIYGEPGCGKSQIGRYLSSALHVPLLSIASTQLICSYVGETEKAIERVFRTAQTSQPVIIFWDEIDAVLPAGSSYQYIERIITTFSGCVDNIAGSKVFLIAATNRPAALHANALSRFSHKLEIRRPASHEQALSILRACLHALPLDPELEKALPAYVERIVGWTGAEIAALVRHASMVAVNRCVTARTSTGTVTDASTTATPECLTKHDFARAMEEQGRVR